MKRRHLSICAAVLFGSLGATGCTVDPGSREPEKVGEAEQAITSLPASNGSATIDYASNVYWTKPDVAAVQWASPSLDDCSATMIGPNIVYTAAHCGFNAHSITFRTYRRGAFASSDTESF